MGERRAARHWLPGRLAVLAVVLALGVLVALLVRSGGGGDGPAGTLPALVVSTYAGTPDGVEAGLPEADPEPGWVLQEDGTVAVYAAGSSSCPWLAHELRVDADVVTVVLEKDRDGPCTADLTWTTSVIAVPDGVDPDGLQVVLELR